MLIYTPISLHMSLLWPCRNRETSFSALTLWAPLAESCASLRIYGVGRTWWWSQFGLWLKVAACCCTCWYSLSISSSHPCIVSWKFMLQPSHWSNSRFVPDIFSPHRLSFSPSACPRRCILERLTNSLGLMWLVSPPGRQQDFRQVGLFSGGELVRYQFRKLRN